MSDKNINYTLNSIKFICAILVIFIHCRFPDLFGNIVVAISRVAVPFFFMCSGYFCFYNESGKLLKKLPGKVKHVLIITVITIVCYFVWGCILRIFGSSGDIRYWLFEELFTFQSFIDWLVFNNDPIAGPFWFLFALIYCYLAIYFVERFNLYKLFYCLIPICLVTNIFLSEFSYLLEMDISIIYYRNFFLTGFPFFLLGHLLNSKSLFSGKKVISIILFTVGVILSILEFMLAGSSLLYIGTILMAIGMFGIAINYPGIGSKSLSRAARYTLYMYCIHWILIDVLAIIARWTGASDLVVWGYIMPLIIVILSLCGSVLIDVIVNWLKKRFLKKHSPHVL